MLKKVVALGFGAVLALSPLAALAQTDQTAPAAGAPAAKTMSAPSGSHKSQMRHRRSMSHQRARASAHHMKTMKSAPATEAAPKS